MQRGSSRQGNTASTGSGMRNRSGKVGGALNQLVTHGTNGRSIVPTTIDPISIENDLLRRRR
jgi:hypothetical protein